MNIQMVCLADQYISHVNAMFPGSVHDAYILRNSSIPYVMGQLQRHRVWLLAMCTANGIPRLKDRCVDSWVVIVWAYFCWHDGVGFVFASLSLTFGVADLCGCLDFGGYRTVIAAEGEMNASRALKEAAVVMSESPAALQLRYLQTLSTIAAEKNSTVVFPIPVDLLSMLANK
ncbi:hypothetical protein NDU88_007612 [Pleurodeles waltl]|uniref:Uncharacterized protein n=1 Tax=Pleurodeles waltl TaxID=8319 RepID=A0AAV7NVG1_PLEWA|nr:hypothetical protein NDU88_007612 [Pleurodeles waltl]